MSDGWRTKADVLRDLGEVNGRRTGAEHLDRHVVAGERPPPVHHEAPDEEEMSYFSGGHGALAAGDGADPDLAGISTMLKMVSNLDEIVNDNETITLYRNRLTDTISISKLNPHAGEYVPGGNNRPSVTKYSPKKNNFKHGSRSRIMPVNDNNSQLNLNDNGIKPNGIITFKMFKSKNDKLAEESNINSTPNGYTKLVHSGTETNATCNETKHSAVIPTNPNMFKSKSETDNKKNATANENAKNVTESEMTQQDNHILKPNLLVNGLPKRQIEKQDLPKAEDIKEIQEKIKSTIIASSADNSLHNKRQKNVAIATLLKLGMISAEKPVKLIKPEYFEKPPTNEDKEENKSEKDKDLPSTSSSETNVNCIEQDSISKVDNWFSRMESPKPKPQLQEKLEMKDCIVFKKKTTSSVTSHNTSTSKEEKDTKPRGNKAFKPSSYASDLLKKYETNAQRRAPSSEDLGTRLERQLKERDEVIKQKMLARQNAG